MLSIAVDILLLSTGITEVKSNVGKIAELAKNVVLTFIRILIFNMRKLTYIQYGKTGSTRGDSRHKGDFSD